MATSVTAVYGNSRYTYVQPSALGDIFLSRKVKNRPPKPDVIELVTAESRAHSVSALRPQNAHHITRNLHGASSILSLNDPAANVRVKLTVALQHNYVLFEAAGINRIRYGTNEPRFSNIKVC